MGAPKQKWTAEEEAALKAGIAKHGIGKWSTIIKDPEFSTPLHLRTNVDLKDKWRNMNATSGLSRQRCKPVTSNTQVSPMVCDESRTLSTVLSGDETIFDAKPLETISENFPNCGSKRPITRLDDHILEAITNLKEPHGSNRGAIAAYIEERYSAPPNFKRLLAEKLKLLTDDRKLVKVKHQYRIAPSLATLDVKENNSLLLLDDRKDNSIPMTIDTRGPTSPLLDGINCPSQAGRNDQINASLLLKGEKPDYRIAKKNHLEVLTRADIDAELRKMICMTPEEAAYVAAQAVKEAEAAIAEAEQATKEAEDAEREADAARAFAEASSLALKRRKVRW
ncbi:MYB transcription factor [Heracleum sosnowskyi]|uniref:MYB transcription factor n=1 Tax=Heracleum sosnowskyi TaxID=360622 RepID=A0AAD8M543_9APIA|nr:MYB transcription factor [Heracleum sosnowskyi]